ncbi:MAG TPA: type I phosphomannose isomerase catalytic subunit, partial [Deinococcales bacterium]|nr:type I phosphomannose isomerase catalytic subunit [Deinococcales bacterium]
MTRPYPLHSERTLSRRLWGDPLLADLLGVAPDPAGDPYGESWQVWAGNRILNGPLAGHTLQDAADRWGTDLLGSSSTARYGSRFPLLAKFIAAASDLSVQVHPDDAYAEREHPDSGHLGKAEAWLILAARPDAFVYRGFRETVTKDQVREAVTAGTMT